MESLKEAKGSEGSTFFERVFDNLTITIGNIDIRLETFSTEGSENLAKRNEFAFGGCIRELKVLTIDSEKNQTFL